MFRTFLCGLLLVASASSIAASPEQSCIDSFRLKLKDPSSAKIVKNLGKRWEADKGEYFWLRYSGTNSYGGVVSNNVVCAPDIFNKGKWVRDEVKEMQTELALSAWYRVRHGSDGTKYARTMAYDETMAFPQDMKDVTPPPSKPDLRPR